LNLDWIWAKKQVSHDFYIGVYLSWLCSRENVWASLVMYILVYRLEWYLDIDTFTCLNKMFYLHSKRLLISMLRHSKDDLLLWPSLLHLLKDPFHATSVEDPGISKKGYAWKRQKCNHFGYMFYSHDFVNWFQRGGLRTHCSSWNLPLNTYFCFTSNGIIKIEITFKISGFLNGKILLPWTKNHKKQNPCEKAHSSS
jgi:hypothetical protein